MRKVVLDASAVLAVLLSEGGAAEAAQHLGGGCVSAVNYSEILARAAKRCGSLEASKRQVDLYDLAVVAFDAEHAALVASLRPTTDPIGLSFADRACLALGLSRGLPVVTADRAWASLDLDVAVQVIR